MNNQKEKKKSKGLRLHLAVESFHFTSTPHARHATSLVLICFLLATIQPLHHHHHHLHHHVVVGGLEAMSNSSRPACWIKSPIDFSKSSILEPISSMRPMMESDICWKRVCCRKETQGQTKRKGIIVSAPRRSTSRMGGRVGERKKNTGRSPYHLLQKVLDLHGRKGKKVGIWSVLV